MPAGLRVVPLLALGLALATPLPPAGAQEAPPRSAVRGEPGPGAQAASGSGGQDESGRGARKEPAAEQLPAAVLPEVVVTATRTETEAFDVPVSTGVWSRDELRHHLLTRTVPEALRETPSVLVQKTSHGQGSPFIRGFTGFRNLFLIDGVRLNNSVFRDGPNQYWSTVDPLSIERLELTRGPSSVLYGSDAIGGTVNAIPRGAASLGAVLGERGGEGGDGAGGFGEGTAWHGSLHARVSSAEDSTTFRAEGGGHAGPGWGFFAGVTTRSFGDLDAGGDQGRLRETGYDEWGTDWRIERRFRTGGGVVAGFQHVRQNNVPRTHKTIFSVPWHGTSPGKELRRDLDQQRDLAYTRLTVEDLGALADRASVTLSYHAQNQIRDRLRLKSGSLRQDLSGFDVTTLGLSMQLDRATPAGNWTWGVEYNHDEVDSFRSDFTNGVLTLQEIQGPVGDDASYDLLGVYVQDRVTAGDFEIISGVRFTYAAARAEQVDNPAIAGSDPTTPGNVIEVDEGWANAVGSLRGVWHVQEAWNVFGGISQGFRAPNLSDLTAFDATSAVETPSPGLDPENYIAVDAGVKHRGARATGQASVWGTFIDGMIVQSPTGVQIGGVPEVRKDNVGDGYVWGVEAEGTARVAGPWSVFGAVTWMDGIVDQFKANATGTAFRKIRRPLSRLMPLTGVAGVRLAPREGPWWVQAEVQAADKADRLALRDVTDTQRIPPGGTPGYAVVHLRAGVDVGEHLSLSAAVENLTDAEYRLHGSGQNEPGINFLVAATVRV